MLGLYLRVRNFFSDERGQSLAEYALILALIAITLILAVTTLSDQLQELLKRIGDQLGAVPAEPS